MVNVYSVHAETDALSAARPGDDLIIYQWNNLGNEKPSAPCPYCRERIKKAGIRNLYYRDMNLEMIKERL